MLVYTGSSFTIYGKIRPSVAHAQAGRKNFFMNRDLSIALSAKLDNNLNLVNYQANSGGDKVNAVFGTTLDT